MQHTVSQRSACHSHGPSPTDRARRDTLLREFSLYALPAVDAVLPGWRDGHDPERTETSRTRVLKSDIARSSASARTPSFLRMSSSAPPRTGIPRTEPVGRAFRQRRPQRHFTFVRLHQRLGDARSTPEVAVDLKRWMVVEEVRQRRLAQQREHGRVRRSRHPPRAIRWLGTRLNRAPVWSSTDRC